MILPFIRGLNQSIGVSFYCNEYNLYIYIACPYIGIRELLNPRRAFPLIRQGLTHGNLINQFYTSRKHLKLSWRNSEIANDVSAHTHRHTLVCYSRRKCVSDGVFICQMSELRRKSWN